MMLGDLPNQKVQDLPPTEEGNLITVDMMQKLARKYSGHAKVRALALNILNFACTSSQNFIDEAAAIGEYVQQNIAYVRDADGIEQIHDPVYIIDQIQKGVARADCDDMALFIATLLLSIGAKPKFAMVRYRGKSGPYNHIYVVVYDRNWRGPLVRLPIDAIIKDRSIGYEVPYASITEVDV